MKRVIQIAGIFVLLAVIGQLTFLRIGREDPIPAVPPSFPQPTDADAQAIQVARPSRSIDLPIGARREVELAADEQSLFDLSRRERADQYLDWLLFTAVAALRPSPEEYSKIFFDLPPSRAGYMRAVGSFEFGETRSRLIGDGGVLALIPAGHSAVERKDLLASVADEHRKNQAGEFDHLIVVEYELDVDRDRAVLTRREDVPYASLFSSAYGYYEAVAASRSDLERFMGTVDDLTMARKTDHGLQLGGRKLLSRPYRSIGVEEVATVWKAEQRIQKQLADFDAKAKAAFDDLNARWAGRTYRGQAEKVRLEAQMDGEADALRTRLSEERRALKLVNGSGFSLDPDVEYDGLAKAFAALQPKLQGLATDLLTDEQAAKISRGLAQKDVVPLRKFQQTASDTNPLVEMVLERLVSRYSYQAARYDGDLKGTEVGMILFYTDLLAKLWVIDFVQSSPRRGFIAGFIDDPTAPRSLIYTEENAKLRAARLWFGPSNLGFQIGEGKNALYLASNATRIYSAGSDPTNPGVEVQTSSMLAASTDWWNDHYEAVARFEPQYQRLNQVMKWSIVIGWLNETNDGDKLGYLANVEIARDNVLPQWVRRHSELRFTRWSDVQFLPAGFAGTTTEAMPLLSGPVTEGGVSLAPKEIANRAPIARDVETIARRSNLDYAAMAKNSLKTLDESVFTFNHTAPDRFSVLAKAKPEAMFRSPSAQLARTDIERVVVSNGEELMLQVRTAQAAVGDLQIRPVQNGFKVGWRAREVDAAHSLARRVSASPNPELALLDDPNVETVVMLPGEANMAVKLRGSPNWVRLSPEARPSVAVADGWQMRAAEREGVARRSMQASVVDDSAVQAAIGNQGKVVIEIADGGKPLVRVAAQDSPPPSGTVDLIDGDVKLVAWMESRDGTVHVKTGGSGDGADVLGVARRLASDDLAAIRRAAATGDGRPIRVADASRARVELANELENGHFRAAANIIADDPTLARQVVDRKVAVELRHNAEVMEREGPGKALHDLDRLIETYGNRPDLTLRRALVEIERGNPKAAATSATAGRPRPLQDRAAFFDEVNARLAAASETHADLQRFAEFADWQDLAARAPTRDLGAVRPLMDGDQFRFELELATEPSGVPLPLDDVGRVGRGKAALYRQDSVGLDKLDWNGSVEHALHDVVAGRLGTVIQLPREDIAHFRPAAIWTPGQKAHFKPVGHTSHVYVPSHSYRPCDPSVLNCNDDGSPDEQGVYLVVAN